MGEPTYMIEDFQKEAKKIEREGMDDLLNYLFDETDFATAPASMLHHNSFKGGLIAHSLAVLDLSMEISDLTGGLEVDRKSIALCALFHDVCKTNLYVLNDEPATKPQINYMLDLCEKTGEAVPGKALRTKSFVGSVITALKEGKSMPEYKDSYKVKDTLPLGHGEKSVYILQKYINLTDEEALAIRWHLGGFDPGVHFNFPSGFAQRQAFKENKLVALLCGADILATYLIDEV